MNDSAFTACGFIRNYDKGQFRVGIGVSECFSTPCRCKKKAADWARDFLIDVNSDLEKQYRLFKVYVPRDDWGAFIDCVVAEIKSTKQYFDYGRIIKFMSGIKIGNSI